MLCLVGVSLRVTSTFFTPNLNSYPNLANMYISKANANIGAVKHNTSFQQPFYPLHATTSLFCHVAYLFSTVDLATTLSNMPHLPRRKTRGFKTLYLYYQTYLPYSSTIYTICYIFCNSRSPIFFISSIVYVFEFLLYLCYTQYITKCKKEPSLRQLLNFILLSLACMD